MMQTKINGQTLPEFYRYIQTLANDLYACGMYTTAQDFETALAWIGQAQSCKTCSAYEVPMGIEPCRSCVNGLGTEVKWTPA